ncbi:hypothetical protein [Vibrio phage vB_VpaP_SJSY21]|nr:hypothetical protein [Vibrio phage vB_VpaP_SJSY21]
MAKELILATCPKTGCITPTSHRLNKDGYFRKNIGNGVWVMYHRYMWETYKGPIPDGFEIDHKCKNRACCNVEHLQCIDGTQHAVESNETRYLERLNRAKEFWDYTGCKGVELAREFNVTPSCACRWIRGWKV